MGRGGPPPGAPTVRPLRPSSTLRLPGAGTAAAAADTDAAGEDTAAAAAVAVAAASAVAAVPCAAARSSPTAGASPRARRRPRRCPPAGPRQIRPTGRWSRARARAPGRSPTNLPAAIEVARGHGRRLVGEVHVPHLVPGPVRLQSRRHASALREELREVRVRDPRKIRDEQRRDARAGDRRRHRTKTRRPSPHTRSRDRRSDRAKPRASRAPSISQRQVNFHEAARQVTNWTAIFLVFLSSGRLHRRRSRRPLLHL